MGSEIYNYVTNLLSYLKKKNVVTFFGLHSLLLSSIGIALSYGLDDRGSMVRLPARAWNFSLHHRIQNGSGDHPASYPMGTRSSFPGGKAAGE
jgi:hypothetical protein